MDEYEVDLRDYLIVIWERKWIIVGVFVAALVAAAVYSYTLPNEYRATAMLNYQRAPVATFALTSSSSPNLALELPQASVLISVIESSGPVQATTLDGSNLLRLEASGAASPTELEGWLQSAIEAARGFLREQTTERVSERLSALEADIQFLDEQRTSLLARIGERETRQLDTLGAQRNRIVEQLDGLMNATNDEASGGASRQATLLALTSQLQVLQSRMARLETNADAPQPEAGSAYERRLVELETQLHELELAQRRYERLREADWSPLSVTQAPQGSETPVGPNRKLNIAIAGVLGLFVGLLLAFFVHYLQSEPLTARERSTAPSSDPDS